MRQLELKFAARAEADGDVYLPNFTPPAPVDAILIAMEPSFGAWARSREDASAKIAAGFRNFMFSVEDFLLHYAVRHFLCRSGETYHVTDVSKGAMTVAKANVDRETRYQNWATLFDKELDLLAKPDVRLIAIGQSVRAFLERRGSARPLKTILHYSPQAAAQRGAAVRHREREFSDFAETMTLADIVDVANAVMQENSIPSPIVRETLQRLHAARLTESRKKLAFSYKAAFADLSA
jgi:hypothetical protein